MAGDENTDKSQKTEDPTQKRLEEAFKRGQVVTSRELVSFFMFVAMTFMIGAVLPKAATMTVQNFAVFVTEPHTFFADDGSLRRIGWSIWMKAMGICFLLIGAMIVAALAGNMIQHRIVFSVESITPKLEKLSLIKGWGRLFSMRSVVEMLKGIVKITIIGWVAYLSVHAKLGFLNPLTGYDIHNSLLFMDTVVVNMMIAICVAMAFIALFDYLYQRHDYMKNLRMSRQEIKEEYKEQEGDPHIKGKIRQLRAERARKRMMAAVPHADVVVTNPTHYAVALKYDRATMAAPAVVAKGVDKVAERIKDVAFENEVPVVENPPLARALHASVDLDEEVPTEHYQAVAEVIGYVYRLRNKLK
ncbi:flagellar biosynthesis protein FlhB [bacterium]|nr:flagellar biosynthesis protein FlhB [bacterium]